MYIDKLPFFIFGSISFKKKKGFMVSVVVSHLHKCNVVYSKRALTTSCFLSYSERMKNIDCCDHIIKSQSLSLTFIEINVIFRLQTETLATMVEWSIYDLKPAMTSLWIHHSDLMLRQERSIQKWTWSLYKWSAIDSVWLLRTTLDLTQTDNLQMVKS